MNRGSSHASTRLYGLSVWLRRAWRGRRRDERGQAMPLAAVGVFAMALGVLATLNLGQAVHNKIRLQNTADSAAYSLAAMEARTFNYIAFLNRVQIAHYNTAMVVQSYITWVGYHVGVFATTVDMLTTLSNVVQLGLRTFPHTHPVCVIHCGYVALNAAITPVATAAEQRKKMLVELYKTLDSGEGVMGLGHKLVEAMSIFNQDAVWQAQFARAALLNGHILTGMQSTISELDPDISFGGKSMVLNMAVNMAMNSIEYYQTFDNASGLNPYAFSIMGDMSKRLPKQGGLYGDPKSLDDPAKDAYRIMTELCHATRTPQFVSNRTDNVTMVLPEAAAWGVHVTTQKMGQTKLTEQGTMVGAQIPPIGSEGNYRVGKYFSSDDYATGGEGGGLAMAAAAVATVTYTANSTLGDAVAAYGQGGLGGGEKGKHYLYTGPNNTSNVRISPDGQGVVATANGVPLAGTARSYESQGDNHAPWPGYAPYFKFKAKSDRTRDYNQPSTWIFLNKHHKDFQTDSGSHAQLTRAPWYGKFQWQNHNQVLNLDTTIGGWRNSYLFEGLNVISRGMAYYHRPGNWQEHPNFFNPYWRARLAPVGQKLQNFWDRYVSQNITTDSDDQAVKAMVNLLRNAQMDLFTAVITSVITH